MTEWPRRTPVTNRTWGILLAAPLVLAFGCAQLEPAQTSAGPAGAARPASIPTSQLLRRPGGFYTDDGPDGKPPVDLDSLAEPRPRLEPLNAAANEPYTVFGREYVPSRTITEYHRQGTASWYGRKFHGQRTASGEIYDMYALTASHPTLPIPSYARVTNLQNHRSVTVRINDRGPFASGRMMDVSYAAAYKLGFADYGQAVVEVDSIVPTETLARAAEPAPAGTGAPVKARTSEPAPAAEPVPVSSERAGLYLQLGAFSSRANADNFRARIRRDLDWLEQEIEIVLRQRLYRVQLGPYRDKKEANGVAEKIREALEFRPLVIKR